jgi:O-antigen ligase
VGLANYQNSFTELTKDRVNFDYIAPVALTPHNIFLTFYLTTGLLGFVAFIWLLVIFFQNVIAKRAEFSPALVAVMASILAYGLVDTPYFKNDLSLIFWIVWGLAWVI